ncbi:hypothetical protein SAMN05444004_101458 [Jannaschia faecimaris]|uniref:Flagellar basal body-associated protein FliL n=1 Tax=Jannaschia faecimaris TaxID=1244108 RepID=A0A1H3JYR5_9RHOB|nr:hypothetical protein [Jannaschia faecimaris]SDY44468.1 hypothetical protein SAMN05444004_101458 [Jannaschia faecimaris]
MAAVLIVLIAGGGTAAGFFLQPVPQRNDGAGVLASVPENLESVASFRDGFIVPVLRDGQVWSHVVLFLGVSSDRTEGDVIISREPLLRDGMTEALFQHGSLGGFDGDFTNAASMARLRERLDLVLQTRLDDPTAKVLIVSMARQAG